MNKFAVIFLVLFMLIIIIIGLIAVQQDVSTQSQAAKQCTPQEFPDNDTCVEGTTPQLVKGNDGCFVFECR